MSATDPIDSTTLDHAQARKQRSLATVRQVCEAEAARTYPDFRISNIGKLCSQTANRGPKPGTIRNPAGQCYRDIIEEFVALANKKVRPPPAQELDTRLAQVRDPNLRGLLRAVIAENVNLKKDLVTAKQLVENLPPIQLDTDGSSGMPVEVTRPVHSFQDLALLPFEREALAAFVSPAYLAKMGWTLDENGRGRDTQGSVVLPIGVATAIGKIVTRFPSV